MELAVLTLFAVLLIGALAAGGRVVTRTRSMAMRFSRAWPIPRSWTCCTWA